MNGTLRRVAGCMLVAAGLAFAAVTNTATGQPASRPTSQPATGAAPVDPKLKAAQDKLRLDLATLPYRLVHETNINRKRELHAMNADGTAAVNLSKDAKWREMYPHCTVDGTKICFTCDEGEGADKSRNVYYMNSDGTGRKLVAKNARDGCWNRDGTVIAYCKGEFDKWVDTDYASKGIAFYDLKTGQTREHPNKELHHLYVICWSPDGKWLLATVHGGMGFDHAILAIEADGTKVSQIKGINGCRPDISPDGKRLSWNRTDQEIGLADLDLGGEAPTVSNVRTVISCDKKHMVYHADWSPDGRFIAFDLGPSAEGIKEKIRGTNICVADASQINVWVPVTTDGASNMEPDWLPAAK
ncbi:MAG: TolB family protein [Phycisphaerae bacterium]